MLLLCYINSPVSNGDKQHGMQKGSTSIATKQITFEDQQLRMTQQGIPDVHCCTHQVKSTNGQKKGMRTEAKLIVRQY